MNKIYVHNVIHVHPFEFHILQNDLDYCITILPNSNIEQNVYTKYIEKAKWYINSIHVATIYANFHCDEDEIIFNTNTNINTNILEDVFDYLQTNNHSFYETYAHYNTVQTKESRFL
jgi:hypothetical protein